MASPPTEHARPSTLNGARHFARLQAKKLLVQARKTATALAALEELEGDLYGSVEVGPEETLAEAGVHDLLTAARADNPSATLDVVVVMRR